MNNRPITRRNFIRKSGAAAIMSTVPFILAEGRSDGSKKPNSKVAGVQLGCTTYSYREMPHRVDDVIQYLLLAGINSIELRSVAEEDLGIPRLPSRPMDILNEKDEKSYALSVAQAREEQKNWRLGLPMERYEEMRRKFNDAGITVHIAKFAPSSWSDAEIDYAFTAAKVLGSYGITDEMTEEACRRLGTFAEKHKSLAMFHTHGQVADPGFSLDRFLSYSPANRLNLDVGHYFGATGLHPNNVIEKYHSKIKSIHIKDKTGPKNPSPDMNVPFGMGETPVADILLLIKKEKWPINVDVEMEYKVPEGSDPAKEVARCIEYMRNILE